MTATMPYIPSEVLFQNLQTMDMDLQTLSSCMFVNKEWYHYMREKYPTILQSHFEPYEKILGKKITKDNTSFSLRRFYYYLKNMVDYMEHPNVNTLVRLHKASLFVKEISEEKAFTTFHILLNMMHYSSSVPSQTSDMVYLRMVLLYQVYMYIQHILSSSLHLFLQNKKFLMMILGKGKEFEEGLQRMKYAHPSLQKMSEETTRMIRYTCRVVKPYLDAVESE